MKLDKFVSTIILLISSILIFYFFSDFLNIKYPAEDLPAHAEISRRLLNSLSSGQLIFYDRFWFSGWPVFQFYGFLPHLIVSIVSLLSTLKIELLIRLFSLLACSLLPLSFYLALKNLKVESNKLLRTILSISFSFWFLKLDEPFFGVGVGSILGIGLFPQVFGWHCILISLACLFSRSKYLGLVIALSFISHTLSGVVVILFCGIWFLLNSEDRKYLLTAIFSSFGLIAFWLYPFLKYNANYTSADVYRVPRDWLSLIYRYPITEISIDKILDGKIDFFRLIFIFSSVLLLIFGSKATNKNYKNLIIIILLLTVFTASNYISSSNFLALHYYRIDGLIVLPVLVLLAATLLETFSSKKIFSYCAIILLVFTNYNLINFTPENIKLIREAQTNTDQTEVIDYLKKANSRIFVEFNTNYNQVPLYSGHLIESSLIDKEVANGLFVESSNVSRYLSFSAELLEGSSFHGYLVFIGDTDIDKATALKQLQSFSIQTIVASSEKFAKSLQDLIGPPIFTKGVYKIFSLSPTPLIEEVNQPLVGYLDLSNKLPFTIITQYFYSRQKLFNNFQLINLTTSSRLPKQLRYLMVNGEKEQIQNFIRTNKTNAQLIPFYEKAELAFTSARKEYPVDKKVEVFKRVKLFFDSKLNLENKFTIETMPHVDNNELGLNWENNHLTLNNLKSDKLYKINYTYLPLLNSNSTEIFRAGQERIVLSPLRDGNHTLEFSIFNLPYYSLSIVISIISLIFITFKIRTEK